jgi:hypothetical protein
MHNRLKLTLTTVLLAAIVLIAAGCADFGQFPVPQPTEPAEKKVVSPTTVTTADRAILAVYEHLLSLAQSAGAKTYLAEFYAAGDDWRAEQKLFKDGTMLWYVTIDMTGIADFKGRDYWRQAEWIVYPDGKVIPSNRLRANALLIEADLNKLSGAEKPAP